MLAGVPMMNGVGNAGRLYARHRRDRGAAHPRCRRHHRRQGALRSLSASPAAATPTPPGPVHNPHQRGYSAGGSSSGSAALVALGEADMALGGDQGGSIRMPVVVLRHLRHEADARAGAVHRHHADRDLCRPYRSDDRGPWPTTRCCWRCSPGRTATTRGRYDVKTHPYASMLEGGVKGMRIGIVTEGFQQPNAEADVNAKVRGAAARLASLGADGHQRSRSRCTWLAARYGCRSASRG